MEELARQEFGNSMVIQLGQWAHNFLRVYQVCLFSHSYIHFQVQRQELHV